MYKMKMYCLYLLSVDTLVNLSKEPDGIVCKALPDDDNIIAFLHTVLTGWGAGMLTDVGIFIDLLLDGKYVGKTL